MKSMIAKKMAKLETLEEKSFWVNAPLVTILGLLGLTTGGSYSSESPTIISAILCFFIPIVLMLLVYKKKNYHNAYPILCIFVGAISIPLTFVFSGGFLSGMPIFCVIATCITALCYSKRWRIVSLVCCLLGNSIAFYYVYKNGSPFPLVGVKAVYDDVIFAYFASAIAAFISINLIVVEISKYRLNQDALQKYFDIAIRKQIIDKATDGKVSKSSVEQKAAILFADISNFTNITEKMPTEMISSFLNEFFSIAERKIHETDGIIDKYIGDCVMAYWIDKDNENSVLKATKSILAIKKDLFKKSEEIYQKYKTELNFSAGISYGNVIFGDIGSDNMHDYTIIGDAVNTASRIEQYASGGEILLSDNAASQIKDNVILENIEKDLYFKGKNKSINLYRVSRLSDEKQDNEIISSDTYGYSLYVCGCRGSFPVSGVRFSEYGGETSCYVLKKDDYAAIIDCGTGLKNAVEILKDCKKIDILLTHVHYDHILGLLMARLPENVPTTIYGHFNSWKEKENTLLDFMNHPYWPIEIKNIDSVNVGLNKEFELDKEVKATFYRSDHPDEACIIKLMCKDKKVCFFADCEDPNKLDPKIAVNSDLMLYDGMYDDNDGVDHTGWGHGTWQNGLKYAKKQNIKNLIITHHNPEYGDHTLLTNEIKARTENKNVSFAKTGDCIFI